MDPNTEGGPPKVDIAEVEVEVDRTVRVQLTRRSMSGRSFIRPPSQGTRSRPSPPSELESLSSSDIFRNVFRPPPGPPGSSSTVDPEEQRRLHEEEFQRRLKGEYQQAQARLSDVVTSNMDRPLRLTSIRLSPAPPVSRTSFLQSLLSPFLSSSSSQSSWVPKWLSPAPTTLHDVLLSTKALVAHLDRFGVYDMERSSVKLQPVRGGDLDEVELVLGLRERGRLFLKAGTEVGGGEGGGNITARIRNALGGAETLEVNASLGTKTKSAYQASLTTPVLASPLLSFSLQGFQFDRDNTAFASHREYSQGGRAKLSAIAPWGIHDLTYEYIQREIGHLTPKASISIRELAHPSTKSSLSHTWTTDTRNDPWTGTSGRLLKVTNEYAGLPGSSQNAHFFKTIFQSHLSRALYEGSNIRYSISSMTTSLLPLFPNSTSASHPHPPSTYLPDRAFLGGPNSMRGWKVGGVGPQDGPDSLGGDLAWGMGLSVFAPIPKKEHWPLKLHGFMNIGKVVGYDRSAGWLGNAEKVYRNPNVSVGLGLMYRLEPIRVEVNFAMPLVGRKGERLSRGFGIGVGIEFL
ncbi:putative mitochondrion protein [Dioszegia hungarica]|uniref:Mitochondrion protein n=1 Tax=Dioszegia hungarica TaxID=4972 RepID=A0AA38LT61_9TREE|nr:putative mitochondrion protein [Dioszegia hungarica]KAI9636477.1 putative mitochondrion protein [Dioszegia hungarica]